MAMSLNKITTDTIKVLKKQHAEGEKNKSLWTKLSEEFSLDDTWEESLLGEVKTEIEKLLDKLKTKEIKHLWEQSETAVEDYSDEELPDAETMKIDLNDEILEMILDEVEETAPREEYYTSPHERKNGFDDLDEDDLDEELAGSNFFDEDDLDDFDDDDDFIEDDDRF